MIRDFEKTTPVIHSSAYIDPTAMVIGNVEVGEDSSIWPMCVVRGDVNRIRIGERTNIQDGSVLHVTHDSDYKPGGAALIIGNDVTVGHQATLHACTVQDQCLIGMGSIVLDEAVIECGAMLGAGSLVNPGKHIEAGYLWLGRPARRVRELTEKEKAYLKYSASHYVRLQRRHQVGQSANQAVTPVIKHDHSTEKS
jgi:carbonic anhydrase/acetyltransferase-like protein (isoleucine patch superfamily)